MTQKFIKIAFQALAIGLFLGLGTTQMVEAAGLTTETDYVSQQLTCDEYATHWHSYRNTTNPPAGFESHARIYTMRIYLHDDFMQSVDFSQLWCSSGAGWLTDCAEGDGSKIASAGGTEVKLIRNDRSADAEYPNYIQWEFGMDDPAQAPLISDLPSQQGTLIREGLNFVFKDDVEAGSATTTAAVWLKFMQYDQACGDQFGEAATRCWQDVEEDEVPGTTTYHWNIETDVVTSYYTCASAAPVCADLTWTSPAIYSGNQFNVNTLFQTPGPALTARAFDTTGAEITNDVTFRYTAENQQGQSTLGSYQQGALDRGDNFESPSNQVNYRNSQPGDRLRVEVVGAEAACSQELQFPYCTDLDVDPDGVLTLDGPIDFSYTTRASNGQEWPFPATFTATDPNATFDGDRTPTQTTAKSGITFVSEAASGEVAVTTEHDPYGSCQDNVNYVRNPAELVCADLVIENVTTEGDQVCFDWTAELSDDTASPGPFVLESDNPNGTFSTGPRTTETHTCYTGEPGDIITVTDTQNPAVCVDTVTSQPQPDEFVCNDLNIAGPEFEDGTVINLSEPEQVEDLYGETTVCYDFSVETSDAQFAGVLQASGNNPSGASTGTLTLNLDGSSDSGNPARLNISGQTQYSGSVCWQGFPEQGRINVEVIGENACEDDDTLPPLPFTNLVCEDLTLSPEIFILEDDQNDLGDETVRAEVRGSADGFEGTAEVSGTGACELEYADGSDAETDGRLRIPVRGSNDTFEFTARNCEEGDEISAQVLGAGSICEDSIPVEQDTPDFTCNDVSFEPDDVEVGNDETVDIEVDSEEDDNTVIITYECRHDDEIIEYDGDEYDGELILDNIDGDETIENVTFQDVCEDAEIRVEVEDEDCDDELTVRDQSDEQPLGVLKKFLFTFNFAVEKNPYTDESIFFSHDEDRVFYTLEYDPTEGEDSVTFTDDMWNDQLGGRLGNGQDSGGKVHLATNWDELTNARVNGGAYSYKTILKFGFGNEHELGTDDIASAIDSRYNQDNYPVFIPYVQYYQTEPSEAPLIPECSEDSRDLCYDPTYNPTAAGEHKVVIQNTQNLPVGAAIRIRYVGVVESQLNCESAEDSCLTESFENKARVISDDGNYQEASAKLVVLCSYLVTRNAGDVYLDVQLHGGSDISCVYADDTQGRSIEYRNSDGLVILGQPDRATQDQDLSVCDADPYGDGTIGNLSSYVCEVMSQAGSLLGQKVVEKGTTDRSAAGTQSALTYQGASTSFSSWESLMVLKNNNNPNSGILYFTGNGSNSITLGNIVVPAGAWTLVVDNADLVIGGNITYAPTADFRNIPSIAFIVNGGNVLVKNNVRTMSGVYYTDQNIDTLGGAQRSAVTDSLEILGSVYGNIQPLLDKANYVGSPSEDGGGVTIRYDERILLNTPPLLSEVVDIQTHQAIN